MQICRCMQKALSDRLRLRDTIIVHPADPVSTEICFTSVDFRKDGCFCICRCMREVSLLSHQPVGTIIVPLADAEGRHRLCKCPCEWAALCPWCWLSYIYLCIYIYIYIITTVYIAVFFCMPLNHILYKTWTTDRSCMCRVMCSIYVVCESWSCTNCSLILCYV